MKREIKFRGLRTDGKGWVYGWIQPHTSPDKADILQLDKGHDYIRYRVIAESVGQYTGLKDSKAVDIYEGDIIKSKSFNGIKLCVVIFQNGGFVKFNECVYSTSTHGLDFHKDNEVIGNIHEHKDLINVQ